jgi:hypothetical protein
LFGLKYLTKNIIVAAGQLRLTGGAQPIFFLPKSTKNKYKLLLEAQQHKKYAQTTPLEDGVSSLFISKTIALQKDNKLAKNYVEHKKEKL